MTPPGAHPKRKTAHRPLPPQVAALTRQAALLHLTLCEQVQTLAEAQALTLPQAHDLLDQLARSGASLAHLLLSTLPTEDGQPPAPTTGLPLSFNLCSLR